jgi:hypothetical protein
MESTRFEIPIDGCIGQFDASFNRIKYFSQISDNIKLSELPPFWSIKSESGLNHMISAPPEDQLKNLLEGFKFFTKRYLIRDCIESFTLVLDDIFFALTLHGKKAQVNNTLFDVLTEEEKKLLKKFQDDGLVGKLSKIEKKLGIKLDEKFIRVVRSLRDIRHCLSHSNGVVRIVDGESAGKDKRKFCWTTFSAFVRGEETGKKYKLEFGKAYKESSTVYLQFAEHQKVFPIGSILSFSTSEIYEMGFSLQRVMWALIEEINKKLLLSESKK